MLFPIHVYITHRHISDHNNLNMFFAIPFQNIFKEMYIFKIRHD